MPNESKSILRIDGPRPFYSQSDEDHFFKWLQSISGIEQVKGVGQALEITIRRPMEKDSLHDLIALLTRYSLDRRPLKSFCDEQPGDYFRDRDKYWHVAVYG
ncbi:MULTISPECIES: hypothetical protein [unclassified Bradyrhizobium]|uniref:hypothetical protein n=1 Tax=unclassified Bradyrhizobium TaxID=2631580 RepID=UPI00291657D3|nr:MULTISPECIES: hypothetical protein [unclassified Bradyrhizobium]